MSSSDRQGDSNTSERDGHRPPDNEPKQVKARGSLWPREDEYNHEAGSIKVASDQTSSSDRQGDSNTWERGDPPYDNGPRQVKARAEKSNEGQGKYNQEAGPMKVASDPTSSSDRQGDSNTWERGDPPYDGPRQAKAGPMKVASDQTSSSDRQGDSNTWERGDPPYDNRPRKVKARGSLGPREGKYNQEAGPMKVASNQMSSSDRQGDSNTWERGDPPYDGPRQAKAGPMKVASDQTSSSDRQGDSNTWERGDPPYDGPRQAKARGSLGPRDGKYNQEAGPMKVTADQMSSSDRQGDSNTWERGDPPYDGPRQVKARAGKRNIVQDGKRNQEAGLMKAAANQMGSRARIERRIEARRAHAKGKEAPFMEVQSKGKRRMHVKQGKEAPFIQDREKMRMNFRDQVGKMLHNMNRAVKLVNSSVPPWIEYGDVEEKYFQRLPRLYERSSDPRNYGNLFEKTDGKFVPFLNVGPQFQGRRQEGEGPGSRPDSDNPVPDPRNSDSDDDIKSVSLPSTPQPLASLPVHPLGITGTGLQAPLGASQADGPPPPSAANGPSVTSLFDRYPFSFHPDLMNDSQFSQPPPIRSDPPASPASVLRSFPLCEEPKPFHEAQPDVEPPPTPVANQNLGSASPNQDMVPFNPPSPLPVANQNLGPASPNQAPAGGNVPGEFDALLKRIQEMNERMKEFQTLQQELKRNLESGFAPSHANHTGPSQGHQPPQQPPQPGPSEPTPPAGPTGVTKTVGGVPQTDL